MTKSLKESRMCDCPVRHLRRYLLVFESYVISNTSNTLYPSNSNFHHVVSKRLIQEREHYAVDKITVGSR